MSEVIERLLSNAESIKIIQKKLPPAFQTVEDELKGNPAVGLLREQVILGMLIAFCKNEDIKLTESGVNPDADCYINSKPLSIKTVSYNGSIRLKWTSNAIKANQFINTYEPMCDLFVVRVAWGQYGEMRFIPLSTQKSVFRKLGAGKYLDYSGSTNTRGVNLSAEAELMLNDKPESISVPIYWVKSNTFINPVDKWVKYWQAPN